MNKATIRNTPRADALNQLPQRNLYKNGFQCVCALQGTKLCQVKECDGIHIRCDVGKCHSSR